MQVVYVAGPFRAASGWLVELNIRQAEMMAFRVAKAGGVPLCPHTMYRYFNGVLTDHFWLEGTKELLRRCDAIVLLNEWQTSEGSRGERDLAIQADMPVFYECNMIELLEWLRPIQDQRKPCPACEGKGFVNGSCCRTCQGSMSIQG